MGIYNIMVSGKDMRRTTLGGMRTEENSRTLETWLRVFINDILIRRALSSRKMHSHLLMNQPLVVSEEGRSKSNAESWPRKCSVKEEMHGLLARRRQGQPL